METEIQNSCEKTIYTLTVGVSANAFSLVTKVNLFENVFFIKEKVGLVFFFFIFLQSCLLSYNSTDSGNQGNYVVQLVMEDFPRQTITLTQTNGMQTTITTNNTLSKLPVQFVLKGQISNFDRLGLLSGLSNFNLLKINSAKEIQTSVKLKLAARKGTTFVFFFIVPVDPVVPSCTEGLYLPMFLHPTPANGARLYTSVNQTLEISISAQALMTT